MKDKIDLILRAHSALNRCAMPVSKVQSALKKRRPSRQQGHLPATEDFDTPSACVRNHDVLVRILSLSSPDHHTTMQRDPAGRNPLDRFYVVHASSAEQMRHALLTDFGARSFDVSIGAGPFESRGHDCILNHARFSYCSYNTKVRLEFPESTTIRQHFLLNGNSETSVGRSRLVMARHGDSYVIPDQAETQTTHSGDFSQLVVRIDTRALTNKLSAVLGASPGRTLRFDPQDSS